jgi:hypothetical protein
MFYHVCIALDCIATIEADSEEEALEAAEGVPDILDGYDFGDFSLGNVKDLKEPEIIKEPWTGYKAEK